MLEGWRSVRTLENELNAARGALNVVTLIYRIGIQRDSVLRALDEDRMGYNVDRWRRAEAHVVASQAFAEARDMAHNGLPVLRESIKMARSSETKLAEAEAALTALRTASPQVSSLMTSTVTAYLFLRMAVLSRTA